MRASIAASILLAFAVFQSCADGERKYAAPKFGEVMSAQFQLLSEDQMWGGLTSIYKYKDVVAVMAYDFYTPSTFLHFFSLNGEHLDDMVLVGRGPFEVLSTPKTFLRDSTLYLVDIIGQKQISVNLERVVEQKYGACRCEDPDLDILCIYAERLSNGDSLFIFYSDPSGASADDPRIRLVSGGKSVVCTSSPYSGAVNVGTWLF